MIFENRQEAGNKLAAQLLPFRKEKSVILAMPRGGVPIGYEVAQVLHAPLSTIVVRKIGLSGNEEFGIGAIAENGVKIIDETSSVVLGIDQEEINDVIELEEKELQRRVEKYRGGKKLPNLKGKTAILVDDGMATGVTARAAIESVKKLNPEKIILATPVCALDTIEGLRSKVDEVICLFSTYNFMSVGIWYKEFQQVSDDEVVDLLRKAKSINN